MNNTRKMFEIFQNFLIQKQINLKNSDSVTILLKNNYAKIGTISKNGEACLEDMNDYEIIVVSNNKPALYKDHSGLSLFDNKQTPFTGAVNNYFKFKNKKPDCKEIIHFYEAHNIDHMLTCTYKNENDWWLLYGNNSNLKNDNKLTVSIKHKFELPQGKKLSKTLNKVCNEYYIESIK